jgi:hypothetical protein
MFMYVKFTSTKFSVSSVINDTDVVHPNSISFFGVRVEDVMKIF